MTLVTVRAGQDKENVVAGVRVSKHPAGLSAQRTSQQPIRKPLARRDNTTPSRPVEPGSMLKPKLDVLSKAKLLTPAASMNPAATPGTATQTPARPPKAAQGSTWEADLKLYLEGQGATPPSVRSQRNSLVGALHADLKSPTAWLSFLEHEEAVLSGSTNTLDGAFRTNRQGVTLFHLYSWATKVVERHGNYQNIAYLRLWLGFARQQWFKSEDDARDTFKMLKGQHIGDTFAALYADWATLEHSTGNLSKSLSIVEKGIRAGAAPVSSLESMLAQLKNGTFTSRAPGQPGITTGLTSHSGAAHCGDGSHTANMEDTLELTRCKVPGSHEPSAKPPTDTILIHKAAAGALSRGNHTSFSITSSSASEETHTLHSHARMATPATGLTTRSTSSHGSSGDEETVALGIRNTSANKAGGDEPTIIVNRSLSGASQAAKAASYSFASAFRGPKRTGLGGGAMRVRRSTDSDPSSQSAAEGGDESPSDASKKRKADKDAHQSPQPVTSVPGGTKRRQSPEVEVKTMASLAATAESRPRLAGASQPEPASSSRGAAESAQPASAAAQRDHAAPDAGCSTTSGKVGIAVGDLASAAAALSASTARAQACRSASCPVPVSAAAVTSAAQPSAAQPSSMVGTAAQHSRSASSSQPQHAAQAVAPAAAANPPALLHSTATPSAAPVPGPAFPVSARVTLSGTMGHPRAAQPPMRPQAQLQLQVSPGAPDDEEIEDTVPIVNSRLAARALHGRQSIAPGAFKKGSPEEVYVRKVVSEADAPTQPLSKPTAPVAAPVQEDADSTLPLSRPPAASRPITPNAAGQKQVRLETPGSNAVKALSRPTPPAPPSQHYIARPTPPAPPAAEKPAPAVAPRPIMGPPAPVSAANRPRQPLAPVLQPAAPQMQAPPPQPMSAQIQQHQAQVQQQRQRRVREDENTVMVRATRYTKLECVGRGGSSKVFKVMAPNRKIYALKRIKLQGRDAEAASGFIDEITLLQRLRNKQNIIQLVDAEVIQAEGLIYMVLEYGDIDLARLLAKHEKARGEGRPGEVDENFVRLYWQQMLQAVDTIHEARIVHSDLKPANFLMVEGQLKLIDFGIAKAIQSDTTSIARESQVGTLNYMSPEAILGGNNNIRGGPPMKVGRPSDIWSLGCILYQMVYGHTPFSAYPFIQKMHAITDPTHRVDFPPLKNAALLDAMRRCLDRNPRTRITMQELLDHPFLWPEKAANPQGLVGLSRDQLRKLLSHVTQASASGADIDTLSEELFRQLSSGGNVNLAGLLAPAPQQPQRAQQAQQQAPQAVHAPPQLQSQQQEAGLRQPAQASSSCAAGGVSVAAAAAAAALRRTTQGGAGSGSAAAPVRPLSSIGNLQSEILQKAASLKRVEPASKPAPHPDQENHLAAALRKGLEKFHFDDSTLHGEDSNTTSGFSV